MTVSHNVATITNGGSLLFVLTMLTSQEASVKLKWNMGGKDIRQEERVEVVEVARNFAIIAIYLECHAVFAVSFYRGNCSII